MAMIVPWAHPHSHTQPPSGCHSQSYLQYQVAARSRGGSTANITVWVEMAEGPGVYTKGLDQLKEEVTCPLCLGIFDEPKKLSCDHIYCKAPCLEGLVLRSGNGTIVCPECRRVTQAPGNDVSKLATAFHINRLKEVYQTLESTARHSSASTAAPHCKKHPPQPLDLYCESCQELTCRDCILADHQHADHKYGYVCEVVAGHKEAVLTKLAIAGQLQQQVCQALNEVVAIKGRIADQRVAISGEVNTSFDAIIAVLQRKRQNLLDDIGETIHKKLQAIGSQEEELRAAQGDLKELTSSVKMKVEKDKDVDFITGRQQTVGRIADVTGRFQNISLGPVEVPDVAVHIVSAQEIETMCRHFRYKLADPTRCTAKRKGFHCVNMEEESVLSLYLVDSQGNPCIGEQPVTVELTSIRDGMVSVLEVTAYCKSPGQYDLLYKPEATRGRHELSVKISGAHIQNSPFHIFIRKLPSQMKKPIAVIQDIVAPTGIAKLPNGRLVVAEIDANRASIFDSQLRKTAVIKDLARPAGVAADHQSNIYISTSADCQVHKFNEEGVRMESVGGKGTKAGKFDFSNGNTISEDNTLFVCDSHNHRIQVFDANLKFLTLFGKNGTKNGCFDNPSDIRTDKDGNVYVVDQCNDRVQVLTKVGKFIRIIGTGQLHNPVGIHVDRDAELVYVGNFFGGDVSVFHTSGKFICSLGNRYIKHPCGITTDVDGFVYVCDHAAGKVLVF